MKERVIRIDVPILVTRSETEGCFYAETPLANIIRDGDTVEQAIELLKGAFEIMVESRLRTGTLDKHLRKKGYEEDIRWDGEIEHTYFRACGTMYDVLAEKRSAPVPQSMRLESITFPLKGAPAACQAH